MCGDGYSVPHKTSFPEHMPAGVLTDRQLILSTDPTHPPAPPAAHAPQRTVRYGSVISAHSPVLREEPNSEKGETARGEVTRTLLQKCEHSLFSHFFFTRKKIASLRDSTCPSNASRANWLFVFLPAPLVRVLAPSALNSSDAPPLLYEHNRLTAYRSRPCGRV
jgi:hypothetical protein